MNLTPQIKKWIAWFLIAILVVGSNLYLGVSYPLPPPPVEVIVEPFGITHHDALAVTNNATIGGDLTVSGTTSWGCDETTINDDLTITGTLTTQTAVVTDTLDVSGITTLNSSLDVDGNITSGTGAITITDNLNVTGTVDFDSTLNVDGATTLVSTLSVGGDITLENGSTIGEAVDTVIDVAEFFAFTEQPVLAIAAGVPITPTGSYQPITSTAAVTTSTTTAIVSGTVTGQLLVIVNENASDAIIIDDGANTALGGNKTLTGGHKDAIWLMWDGTDWLCIGYNDN